MSFIEIDPSHLPIGPEGPTEATCWLAREALGAYMLEGCDVDYPNDGQPPKPSGELKTFIGIDDEDADCIYDVILHETHQLQINDDTMANLSNRPYILMDSGSLYPWTRPGYVALHFLSKDLVEFEGPPEPDCCEQVVFRLPVPDGDEAAIFHGFNMDEENRVTDPQEIQKLNDFLRIFIKGVRSLMHEEDFLDGTYLSQTPEDPVTLEMSFGLPRQDE